MDANIREKYAKVRQFPQNVEIRISKPLHSGFAEIEVLKELASTNSLPPLTLTLGVVWGYFS